MDYEEAVESIIRSEGKIEDEEMSDLLSKMVQEQNPVGKHRNYVFFIPRRSWTSANLT